MWGRIFLFFLMLTCNIHDCCFLINDEDKSVPGLGLSQREPGGSHTTVKQVLISTFSRRNMPMYIYEYQRLKMARGHRPCVSSRFYALLEYMATFSLMF